MQNASGRAPFPAGGCNVLLPVVHALVSAPRVFTLQLAWESHQEQPHNIAATLAAVDERVSLPAMNSLALALAAFGTTPVTLVYIWGRII